MRWLLKKPRRPIPWDESRRNVLQLARDRGDPYITGPSLKDFSELGAPSGMGSPFTAEFVKRYFGEPSDPENPESEYVENLRGASHAIFEQRVEMLKRSAPTLHDGFSEVFPRDEGGHNDYEWYEKKAKEVGGQWRGLMFLVDSALDLLASYCQYDDLLVIYARARSKREEKEMEQRNARIVEYYAQEKRVPERSEKTAARLTAVEYGISADRVRQIARLHREEMGEEKRPRGRPSKAQAKAQKKGA